MKLPTTGGNKKVGLRPLPSRPSSERNTSIFPLQGKCKVPEGLAPGRRLAEIVQNPLTLAISSPATTLPTPHPLHPPQSKKGRREPKRWPLYLMFPLPPVYLGLAAGAGAGFGVVDFAAGAAPAFNGYAWSNSLMISWVMSTLLEA